MDAAERDQGQKIFMVKRDPINQIIGNCEIVQELRALIKAIAANDSNILITGDTGVGKSLVAQVIHEVSEAKGQLIRINCHNIPFSLLEDELFGHKAGAYTDAKSKRAGKLAAAHNGTLVFEEIGDMPKEMQGKLLSVLEEKEFSPVGSDEFVNIKARVVATTNKDIQKKVARKEFRSDLFHRFDIHLYIPPLKERLEDLDLLTQYYFSRYTEMNKQKIREELKPLSLVRFMKYLGDSVYDWPGNVRELKKLIKQYVDLSGLGVSGKLVKSGLTDRHIKTKSNFCETERHGYEVIEKLSEDEVGSLNAELWALERGMVISALEKTRRKNGNLHKQKAADLLSINRVSLNQKMKRLEIENK